MTKVYFVLFLVPLFYLVRKEASFHAIVRHGNHTRVFYYLADVSNFQLLNPTIIEITHWERVDESNFYVRYTECLSQVPLVRNHARAYYRIHHDVDGSHGLLSQHFTCFFYDLFCLSTNSILHIRKLSKSEVGYREEISYFCPWALTAFCYNEISHQRKLITRKLSEIFTEKPQNIFPQNIN